MVYFGHPFILMGVTGSWIYDGKRLTSGYLIRAGEAAKKWNDKSNWISYKSKADDIKAALLDGNGSLL